MKILMVDDDADDRYLSLFAFKRLDTNHTLEFINGGQELIEHLITLEGSTDELPDLILLDLNMPEMNGKMVLAQIKARPKLRHLPIAIFSTSNSQKDIDESLVLGAENFIIKPSNLEQLMEVFKKIFA